jgi:hypothetical protein
MDHPSIVYEIFELPGPVGETYTEAQRDYVKARREAISARLAAIEAKIEQESRSTTTRRRSS